MKQPTEGRASVSGGKSVCPFHLAHNGTTPPCGCLCTQICLEAWVFVNKCSIPVISSVCLTDKCQNIFIFFQCSCFHSSVMQFYSRSVRIVAVLVSKWMIRVKLKAWLTQKQSTSRLLKSFIEHEIRKSVQLNVHRKMQTVKLKLILEAGERLSACGEKKVRNMNWTSSAFC